MSSFFVLFLSVSACDNNAEGESSFMHGAIVRLVTFSVCGGLMEGIAVQLSIGQFQLFDCLLQKCNSK